MSKYVSHELFVCDCSEVSHQIILTTWDFKDGSPSLELSIKNNIYLPFYKRAWQAIKYVLKIENRSEYDVVLLNNLEVVRLKESLEKYLDLNKKALIEDYKF